MSAPWVDGGEIACCWALSSAREMVIAPRRTRIYVARAAYVAALLVLMSTAWLVLTGTQLVRDVGDLARFGAVLFQILAPLQSGPGGLLLGPAGRQRRRPGEGPADAGPAAADAPVQQRAGAGETAGQPAARAGPAGGRPCRCSCWPPCWAASRSGQIGRVFAVTAGQRAGLRQPGLDLGPVAGEDLPGPGHDRAGAGALAGRGRDGGRRRPGRQRWPASPATAWAAALSPWQAVLEATRPYVQPLPAAGRCWARRSICSSWRPW